jgi:hypothetical protein
VWLPPLQDINAAPAQVTNALNANAAASFLPDRFAAIVAASKASIDASQKNNDAGKSCGFR